jgi:uridine kinase
MARDTSHPIIIGVAGGTGSGKTTVTQEILRRVGQARIAYIPHDAYYRPLAHLPPNLREQVNFDHPDSLETDLLVEHLELWRSGQAIEVPVYDFTTHMRTAKTVRVEPQRVALVDGILVFAEQRLREVFDVKLYVDADADIRFIRRLRRDIDERGRSMESVIKQYLDTVRPMHLDFVEPSKRYADVIIPEGGYNQVAMDMVVAQIERLLAQG